MDEEFKEGYSIDWWTVMNIILIIIETWWMYGEDVIEAKKSLDNIWI